MLVYAAECFLHVPLPINCQDRERRPRAFDPRPT